MAQQALMGRKTIAESSIEEMQTTEITSEIDTKNPATTKIESDTEILQWGEAGHAIQDEDWVIPIDLVIELPMDRGSVALEAMSVLSAERWNTIADLMVACARRQLKLQWEEGGVEVEA